MRFKEFQVMTYEDGLNWIHKGKCGADAYPTTQVGDTTVWECIFHGFISAHAVARRKQ